MHNVLTMSEYQEAALSKMNPIGAGVPMPNTKQEMLMPRVVLFDDDPLFSRAMVGVAKRNSIPFVSVTDVAQMPGVAATTFDLAIVDYDLGSVNGIDLAQLVEMYGDEVPILLVSYTQRRPSLKQPWPASIARFVLKEAGAKEIMHRALELYRVHQQAHKLKQDRKRRGALSS